MIKKTLFFLFALLFATNICYGTPRYEHPWETGILGTQPSIRHVRLYGFNGAMPATFEAVWPESTDYIPLQAAMSSPYCASTSAADDGSPVGTGARTLRVRGLTTAFAEFTEDITLDGQTSVVLATADILMFDSAEVLTAGSGLMNAGQIDCGTGANTAGSAAVVHLMIPASSETAVTGAGNKSAQFIYGVPDNYTLICRNIQAGSVFATEASSLQVRIEGYTNSDGIHKQYYGVHAHNVGSNPTTSGGMIKFPEKTIVVGKMAGPTGSNVGPVFLSAECLLINNDYLRQEFSTF